MAESSRQKIYRSSDGRAYMLCITHNCFVLSDEGRQKHRYCEQEVFR